MNFNTPFFQKIIEVSLPNNVPSIDLLMNIDASISFEETETKIKISIPEKFQNRKSILLENDWFSFSEDLVFTLRHPKRGNTMEEIERYEISKYSLSLFCLSCKTEGNVSSIYLERLNVNSMIDTKNTNIQVFTCQMDTQIGDIMMIPKFYPILGLPYDLNIETLKNWTIDRKKYQYSAKIKYPIEHDSHETDVSIFVRNENGTIICENGIVIF